MPDENEQKKEHTKISIRIGDAQVELEGTYENIKKLMGKEMVDFTEGLKGAKPLPSPTEIAPKITPKTPEVTPREKPVPPPSKPPTPSEAAVKPLPVAATGKTTEKMGKKRTVSRNAVIALVLVLALLASLVSVIAIYVPMVSSLQSQITEKDNAIVSLGTQVTGMQNALNQLANNLTDKDNRIADLNTQLTSIAEQYNAALADYNSIITLGKRGYLSGVNSAPFNQEANTSAVIWEGTIEYAGYVIVELQSTSNTTYAKMVYSAYGVNFNQTITVGASGTAAFPVLPGAIEVSLGNTETVSSVTGSVTATYVY
jgi:hypothetical protein